MQWYIEIDAKIFRCIIIVLVFLFKGKKQKTDKILTIIFCFSIQSDLITHFCFMCFLHNKARFWSFLCNYCHDLDMTRLFMIDENETHFDKMCNFWRHFLSLYFLQDMEYKTLLLPLVGNFLWDKAHINQWLNSWSGLTGIQLEKSVDQIETQGNEILTPVEDGKAAS